MYCYLKAVLYLCYNPNKKLTQQHTKNKKETKGTSFLL